MQHMTEITTTTIMINIFMTYMIKRFTSKTPLMEPREDSHFQNILQHLDD